MEKIFRELYIFGSDEALRNFHDNISQYISNDWKYTLMYPNTENEFMDFEYIGNNNIHAAVGLFFDNEEQKYYVANIIPIDKDELSKEEYNSFLLFFYESIIKKIAINGLKIQNPTSDIFEKSNYLSETSQKMLSTFSLNKSTGSSHPLDRERWYEFILRTFREKEYLKLNSFVLKQLLLDDKWEHEKISELISEYEFAIGLLCKEKELANEK